MKVTSGSAKKGVGCVFASDSEQGHFSSKSRDQAEELVSISRHLVVVGVALADEKGMASEKSDAPAKALPG